LGSHRKTKRGTKTPERRLGYEIRARHYRKKTGVAWTRLENGGYTAGTEGLQQKAGIAKEKLDGHHQTRSEGYGHYLG